MKKKLLAVLLTLVLALSLAVPALAGYTPVTYLRYEYPPKAFYDVGQDEWYHDNLLLLTMAGGIDGYEDGTFRPQSGLRLCEFIKIVVAILYPGVAETDFAGYHFGGEALWYSPYVGLAESVGLLEGVNYTKTALEANVNRYNMALLATNALRLMGENLSHDDNIRYFIGDYDSIPAKYRDPVCDAYQSGILMGKDTYGNFCGNDGLTRAETCTVVMRLFEDTARNHFYGEYWDVTNHCRAVVLMPEDWKNRSVSVLVDSSDFCVNYFCTAAMRDTGGLLFSVVITDRPVNSWPSGYRYLGATKKGNEQHHVYIVYPGDVQYDYTNPEIRVEYASMLEDMESGQVKINVTMH